MPEITTTQFDRFAEELKALVRSTNKRTAHGKLIAATAMNLLEHPKVSDEILAVAKYALGDHETLRRIRSVGFEQGYEAGYDQGTNDALGTTPSEEDD